MTTSTTTEVICDRCDRRTEIYLRDSHDPVELPFRWMRVEYGDSVMDVCPDCKDSFERWRSPAPAVIA